MPEHRWTPQQMNAWQERLRQRHAAFRRSVLRTCSQADNSAADTSRSDYTPEPKPINLDGLVYQEPPRNQ